MNVEELATELLSQNDSIFLFNVLSAARLAVLSGDDHETEHPTGCYHRFTRQMFRDIPVSLEQGGECEPDEILQLGESIVSILCSIVPVAKGRVPLENI